MTTRLDLRASVTVAPRDWKQAGGLKLTLRCEYGELRRWLPDRYSADGTLVDGDLCLYADDLGARVVTHMSCEGAERRDPRYDYAELLAGHLGVEVLEPQLPVTVSATCELGLVVLDQLDPSQLLPRRVKDDPRVERVLRALTEGRPATELYDRLPRGDRAAAERLRAGAVHRLDVPVHVALLVDRL